MSKKPLCFVISPIGEPDSETRRNADDLLDLIIRPALDIFGFDIIRGDHRSEANQIDVDVIKAVQEAHICIADISVDNVNVFYEIGRRDETGKPLILLKHRNSRPLPVDIGTRRYIEFDLDDRHGIRDACQQLRNFVTPLVEEGFESGGSSASLSDLAAILQRVERKLDRIATAGSKPALTPNIHPDNAISNPKETFMLARKQNNVALMEACLDQLAVMMDKWEFLDYYVELTAARGSQKAGEMMIAHASEFIDEPSLNFRQKVEYLSCLVSYAGRRDRELELLELVMDITNRLEAVKDGKEPGDVAEIYNQRNRLYYGVYALTKDAGWLEKAVFELKRALEYVPNHTSFLYNLAMCYSRMDGCLEMAVEAITKVLSLDMAKGKDDDDHLELAYRLYDRCNDPRKDEVIERLQAVNPVKAQLLLMN